MNTLHVMYANSGDAWGIEDGTPAKAWYFRSTGEVHDYANSHNCIVQFHDAHTFHDIRALCQVDRLLTMADLWDWPLWDAENPADGIRPERTWLDEPFGYDPDEDVEELARDDDGNLITGEGPKGDEPDDTTGVPPMTAADLPKNVLKFIPRT